MITADTVLLVPSKGRPELFRRLVESVRRTAVDAVDVWVVLCESDVEVYRPVLSELNGTGRLVRSIRVADDFDYPMKLNRGAELVASGYTYLAMWNDDHEAITLGWDLIFKHAIGLEQPFGLVYGYDGIWEHGQVPSAPFMTSSFYTALGWVALPGLQHILVDNVWKDLAKAVQACWFLPGVIVQHHHLDNGEAEMDDTYRETNGNELRNQMDREVWWAWLESEERADNERALAQLWDPPREITRP